MKIKTSDLTGAALDWAVAKCEDETHDSEWHYAPSTDWTQGGPIIERGGIGFFCNRTFAMGARFHPDAGADWRAFALNKHGTHYYGPTPLIAAMRCYVASKLGDELETSNELIGG